MCNNGYGLFIAIHTWTWWPYSSYSHQQQHITHRTNWLHTSDGTYFWKCRCYTKYPLDQMSPLRCFLLRQPSESSSMPTSISSLRMFICINLSPDLSTSRKMAGCWEARFTPFDCCCWYCCKKKHHLLTCKLIFIMFVQILIKNLLPNNGIYNMLK